MSCVSLQAIMLQASSQEVKNPTPETMVELLEMQLYDASRQVREAAVRLVTQLSERADMFDRGHHSTILAS